MFLSFSSVWPLQNEEAQILCFCCPSFSGLVPDRVVLLSLVFSMQIIYFSAYRSYASYVSCTICIICNKCICVFPQIFNKNVTNYFVSMYHVYHMYHVPYVSYVTNVFVYSHICPGICPKNVTNFCGCVLHASVVATVVRMPRSEVSERHRAGSWVWVVSKRLLDIW